MSIIMGLPITALTLALLLFTNSVHSYPYYHQNSEEINLIFNDFHSLDNWLDETINSIFNLGKPDGKSNNENDLQVDESNKDTDDSSEETEEYVEDDIIISETSNRNGLRAVSARWPGGVIPYEINSHFNAEDKKLIEEAMDVFHKNTCIRFTYRKGMEEDFIRIRPSEYGCGSYVGRKGGKQKLNISPKCSKNKGKIIHELMHVVGFRHEQCRSDRDQYVEIKWENIKDGKDKNFIKYDSSEVNDFGVSYDYGSVMHYASLAFSRNGQPTIVVKGNKNVEIGQREGLSMKDIQKIRKMYKC